jgi:exopolysaccharide biosynthesis polyprenyl glycosylphosphotransferase
VNVEAQIPRADQGTRGWVRQFAPALRVALPFSERRALLILGDALLVNVAVLGALYLWARIDGYAFTFDFVRARWFWFPILTGAWWFLAGLGDLYDVPLASRRPEVVWRVVFVIIGLVAGYLVVYFLSPRDTLPRLFFLFFSGIALVCVVLWRWAYGTVFTLPSLCRRVLIVGAGWAGRTLVQTLSGREAMDYEAVGFVDDDPAKQSTVVAGLPVLGSSADLRSLVRTYCVDEVVLAVTHEMRGELFQALMDCRAMAVQVIRMPDLYEQLTRRIPVEHINEEWVLDALNDRSALARLGRAAKRLLDLACGLTGLVGLGLLFPFVVLAIWLDDRGVVIYTQTRSGLDGKPFRVIKFRTMCADAEEDTHPQWAQENDDRVTRVGRLLRSVRLDELPQVINVLRGEMSVVGPRPERPEFIADLQEQIPFYRTRLVVKPGLTGWAQTHYRYGSSVEDALMKLQYDLYYIRHQSLWLDLSIILKTFSVVLRCQGT